MTTQELKEQAHKEFDSEFLHLPNTISTISGYSQELKTFIDSLIDKTVQMERDRIVGIIEEFKRFFK